MIGRIEETSPSSKPDPRLDPTRLPLADCGQPLVVKLMSLQEAREHREEQTLSAAFVEGLGAVSCALPVQA
jgi:hypothetical protein